VTTPPTGPDDVGYGGSEDGDPAYDDPAYDDPAYDDPAYGDWAGGAAPSHRGRTIALVAALVLAAAAAFGITTLLVGDSEPDPAATPTSSPPPQESPAASPEPSAEPSPEPSAEPSPTTTPVADLVEDGPDFGFIANIPEDGQVLQLDRATFLTGAEANTEAERRGLEVPVSNDYLITNDNPQLRDYPISPDVRVTLTIPLVPDAVDADPVDASLSELRERLAELDPAARIPFDLVLEDGQIVEINQVYVP